MTQLDAFERYAATQAMPHRRKAVRVVASDKQAPMVPSPLEQKQLDQQRQFARYKKSITAEHQSLLNSEFRANYRALLQLLKTLTPKSSHELLSYVRRSAWMKHCSIQQRHIVLAIIDAKIIRLRELNGQPPFDDPLPGEPPNLFLAIRKQITGV